MLEQLDRMQVSVADRTVAAAAWRALLDAVVVREDRIEALACRRTVLGVGTSEVELLEEDGPGAVREAGLGLFAAGFSSPDVASLRARFVGQGVAFSEEGDQLLLSARALGGFGLRAVVTPAKPRDPHGLLQRLYETTLLVSDAAGAVEHFARCFGLDTGNFVPIRSAEYGYDGTLTLFRAGELDRVEIIHPFEAQKTMGRFFRKRGPSLYMGYGESDRADEIRDRALELAPDDFTGPRSGVPDNLFLHPAALGGVMLGVSRTTYAWTWSGSPERVEPVSDRA